MRLEGENAALEEHIRLLTTPTPVVCPPQHVHDLATAICDSTARPKGILVSFICRLCVVRGVQVPHGSGLAATHFTYVWPQDYVFFTVNEVKVRGGNNYEMGFGGTASARDVGVVSIPLTTPYLRRRC